MKRNKIFRIAAAVFTVALMLSSINVFAFSAESGTAATTEKVIEDNRTLTPKGNAELTDDVTDNENLQFITVTSKDGNVFYFVIDKGAESENVYFLNTVDDSDLEALAEEAKKGTNEENPVEETQKPITEPEEKPTEENPKETEQPKNEGGNNMGFILVILALAGIAGAGFYYFKVLLPKKQLEQADDIEDFEFEEYDEDENEEETEPETNEDDTE